VIVWRVTGNEIGPHGNGAAHYATKAQARLLNHRIEENNPTAGTEPERIVVNNREQLAEALDDAMGYGAS
jgi:hypothetical protein